MSSKPSLVSRMSGTLIALAFSFFPAYSASDPQGLPNFHKVDEHVYRGGQPTAEGFQNLAKLGVKTILDLRGPEHSESEEKRIVEAAGMRYVSIPMKGMHTPTEEQVSGALALLNDQTAWPVFVHCKRGADRTGAVVACYRIGHDQWQNGKALAEARDLGMSWYQKALQHYVGRFQAVITAPVAAAAPAAATK